MRNSHEDILYLQDLAKDKNFFTMGFHVRTFLCLTSALNGIFVASLNVSLKLTFHCIKNNHTTETLTNPLFYVFCSLIVLSVFANIYNLNLTMQTYSQLYVVPFLESCSMICNLTSGLFLIGEYHVFSYHKIMLIFVGCLISICGMSLKL